MAALSDVFSLASWGGGTDEFGNPSYTQVDAGNQAGDPTAAQTLAKLQTMGAVSTPTGGPATSTGVGFNVNWDALPKVAGTNLNPSGFMQWASPQQSNSGKLFDPSLLINDPNYGWLTPSGNVKSDNDFLTKVGNLMPTIIALGMSMGGAGLIGAAGGAGSLFSVPKAAGGISDLTSGQGTTTNGFLQILQQLGLLKGS